MEHVSLSVALIRKTYNQSLRWLARLNPTSKKLGFVIGERLNMESFRETTIREVAWELLLDRQRDFLVSNMAQLNLEFVDRMPGHYDKSRVVVSFYNVEVYRKEVVEALESDRANFWVTSEEICNGVTRDGRRFDPLVPYLINRSSVIQYWESSQGN
ncbi:MAG: hypothetical protein ACI87E_005226 [Mariniblastus sp.]|jgi:hypothetical protein